MEAIHGGVPAWVNLNNGLTACGIAGIAVLAEIVSVIVLRALAAHNQISPETYRNLVEKVIIVGAIISGVSTCFGVYAIVWAVFQSQCAAALLAFMAGLVVTAPQLISIPSLTEYSPSP